MINNSNKIQKVFFVMILKNVNLILNSHTSKESDLRFVFNDHQILYNPEVVISSINQKIKEYLISKHL